MMEDQDRRPIPDPTILTTQQLLRELGALSTLFMARFEAMDKAIVLTDTNNGQRVSHLRELMDEKFGSVETQFDERDVRVEETSKSNKVAIDAALQSAEKAVDKSNSAITKQIDQLSQLFQTTTDSLKDRLNEANSRIERIEARGSGIASSWGVAVAIVGMLIGVGGIVLSIVR